MDGRFRNEAPAPQHGWILRSRLVRRMARRFEVPVTLLVAPAGYGKTTLLSQSVADSAGSPGQVDLWVQCNTDDTDGDHLAKAILDSANLPDVAPDALDAAALAEALAWFAPAAVCLVLDDLHRIPAGSSGMALVEGLLDRLPSNGHLLLSSRTYPPIPLVRRELSGMVEQMGTADLEFDDTEINTVDPDIRERLGEAARWPAMSALSAESSYAGPVDLLLEEVASSLEPRRLAALTALAHIGDIGDAMASAATQGLADAAELVADLPLVQRSPDGGFQLHDLWKQVLTAQRPSDVGDDSTLEALRRVAQVHLRSGSPVEAARLFALADDPDGVSAAVLDFMSQPLMALSTTKVERMAAIARDSLGDGPLTALLDCAHQGLTSDERSTAERYEVIARAAELSGDEEAEVLALQAAANMYTILDPDFVPEWIGDRAGRLAAGGHRLALTTSVLARSSAARVRGEAETAAATLQELAPPSSGVELVTFGFGMNDLGRPEQVGAPSGPSANEAAVSAGGHHLAAAIWLRGDVSPEVALDLGIQLVDSSQQAGFPHVQVPTHAVFTFVALAAGDISTARRFASAALSRASASASVQVHVFAGLADALCVLCERGEAAARPLLESVIERLPISHWPTRPHLYALPTLYALVPDVRPVLEGCRFGPALTTAVDAGRALVAIREAGDPRPATQLPWDRPDLLRAHVLPPHLATLAAAAAAGGHGGVGAVLASIPALREHLVPVATLAHKPTASWAASRVASLPARPDHGINVEVLGPMRLFRGETPVADDIWVKRERVRQLLAVLVLHRKISRRSLAELLWPDLPPTKALGNLRVNLSHLQRVLQPDRPAEDRPWFVQTDGEQISVASSGVAVDADRLDELHRRARTFDDKGQVRQATASYSSLLDLWRGDYLEDWPDAPWADVERIRLRTLQISARCRLGELLLARGEPEEATRHAALALGDDPLREQAGRLLAYALAAQGDRTAARKVLRDLLSNLGDDGLRPEPATEALARTYGIYPLES